MDEQKPSFMQYAMEELAKEIGVSVRTVCAMIENNDDVTNLLCTAPKITTESAQ